MKVAEEKQLKKLNEKKNNLLQNGTDKDDNKHLLRKKESTSEVTKIASSSAQPTSAITKGVFAGSTTALLGIAATVALFQPEQLQLN
ncbi:hypothetical protein [Wolbachia pipientis]|uniref:hypothetical protein n=1 Tax=Wolbachia pipientis TaxID=955 RepID=UPI0025A43C8C|nr:hypothetical protein [Wolbachia pipientis]MDM8335779.1 hypothetical protein [Wolbachia pipientis]